METQNVIEVSNITKKFKVYLDKGHTLKEKVLFQNRRKYEERNVLNGITFSLKRGEAVGLIGNNGCGKSTTLKLLTKIMFPDSGKISMQGRVSSLIELGAGFHPDMSGRENIYINASIFGLTRKEIEHRLDDIIAFSELEKFIDNPVRTYSSGMYMRLAFSVAINVDADILLIDEILAVGDAGFQSKCFNRLKEIKANGTTIVLVSHSMGQIEQICDRTIWLYEGKIRAEGIPRDITPQFLEFVGEERQQIAAKEEERNSKKNNTTQEKLNAEKKESEKKESEIVESDSEKSKKSENVNRWGNGNARIKNVSLFNEDFIKTTSFKTGKEMIIQFEYDCIKSIPNAVFGIGISRIDGIQCYGSNTRIDKLDDFNISQNGIVKCYLKDLPLLAGSYTIDIAIESEHGIPVDYYKSIGKFEVFSSEGDVGIARIKHEWEF